MIHVHVWLTYADGTRELAINVLLPRLLEVNDAFSMRDKDWLVTKRVGDIEYEAREFELKGA
jgi:hypothetical protein